MTTLILGFGKTGQSLNIQDAIIYDDKKPIDIPWDQIDCVIQSAGIPPHHSIAIEAKTRHLPIKTDLDLFFENFLPKFVIGITGTNGKSTVTSMISHLLKENGFSIQMGGNIGIPVLNLEKNADIYVLELSSYQLALSSNHDFTIGVWTNTSIDHLEWHGSFENYIESKARLKTPVMITNDKIARSFYSNIFYHFYENENLSLVYSVGLKLGLSHDQIIKSFTTFQSLPHRQEVIAQKGHITFINDSKATNIESTQYAFSALKDRSIFWIAGGKPKKKGLDGLDLSCVEKAYYIGEAALDFHDSFPGIICSTLQEAVEKAYQDALQFSQPCLVLLSPACSSLDQFENFEHRGAMFQRYVSDLC